MHGRRNHGRWESRIGARSDETVGRGCYFDVKVEPFRAVYTSSALKLSSTRWFASDVDPSGHRDTIQLPRHE
jgi:hypothetical protein